MPVKEPQFSSKYLENKFFESFVMIYFTCSGAMPHDIDVSELNDSDDVIDSIIDDYSVITCELVTN